jgi:hypothetical protein
MLMHPLSNAVVISLFHSEVMMATRTSFISEILSSLTSERFFFLFEEIPLEDGMAA